MKPVDWQRVWRGAGIQFLVLFTIAAAIRGMQPKIGASTDTLVAFYDGDRTRILISTVVFGFAILNLMWFGTAIASALRDVRKGGWGAAAAASSTAFAGILFLIITINTALAYSIAGSGNAALTSGLNDFAWVLHVLEAFPVGMLIMAGSFGLWRAGMISTRGFALGVTAIVFVLARTTTWASDGFWAPDGACSQYVSTLVMGALDHRHNARLARPSLHDERLRPRCRARAVTPSPKAQTAALSLAVALVVQGGLL